MNDQQTMQIQVLQKDISESEGQEQMSLQQLKDSIHLSAHKLLELTYSEQKYIKAIVSFNLNAIEHIQRQQHLEAMVYLAEAQRTLEYGASCGKSIDRNLIICILNNQSCCYYREAELSKCASYLEGVIYNLKAFATSMESSPSHSSLLGKNKNMKNDEFYHVSVQKKIQLVQYNLRYCTINSQVNKRQIALQAGLNVVKLVNSLFDDIVFQNPKLFCYQTTEKDQELMKQFRQFLKGQVFFKEQIKYDQLQTYRKLTRVYVKKWNQRKLNNRINRNFQKHIREYSISQVIQIIPVQYNSNSDEIYQKIMNPKVILRQILHLSMGYFTISTEHRLLAQHRYPKSLQQKTNSQQWKSANIYHLFGILFLSINLNSDLLFMKQLISSYEQHYKCEILVEQQMSDQELQSLSQSLLFQVRKSKNSKQNQILFEKISKLKQKQKTSKKSKSKGSQYKTLNSNKLNISKQIAPKLERKRSLSKNQISSVLSSSKMVSQKTGINSSIVDKIRIFNQSQENDKTSFRKRSHSKDSIKEAKPVGNLGVEKFNKIQRTTNQYQLETPTKRTLHMVRKRRVSSISSQKQILCLNDRQNSKNLKTIKDSENKHKMGSYDKDMMKSPKTLKSKADTRTKIKSNVKELTPQKQQKLKRKKVQKHHTKQKTKKQAEDLHAKSNLDK